MVLLAIQMRLHLSCCFGLIAFVDSAGANDWVIFINYRRDDTQARCDALKMALERFFGDKVFQDTTSIVHGSKWPEKLRSVLHSCPVVIVLIGPRWTSIKSKQNRGLFFKKPKSRLFDPKDWVRSEIEYALENNKIVLPMLVDGASKPDPGDVPKSIQPLFDIQASKLRASPDWDHDVNALVKEIQNRLKATLTIDAYLAQNGENFKSIKLAVAAKEHRGAHIQLDEVYLSLSSKSSAQQAIEHRSPKDFRWSSWIKVIQKNKELSDEFLQQGLDALAIQIAQHEKTLVFERLRQRLSYFESEITKEEATQVLSTHALELWLLRHDHLLIEGEPGSGKTTTLRYITWILSQGTTTELFNILKHKNPQADIFIPVYMTLRDLLSWLKTTNSHGFKNPVVEYLQNIQRVPNIDHYLKQGQAVILFDGLDEIEDRDSRINTAEIIRSFITTYGTNNRMIVASRPSGLGHNIQSTLASCAKLGHVKVEALNMGEIKRFIRAWYKAIQKISYNQPIKEENRAEKLINRLKTDENLRKLATTPVLLTGIISVHSDPSVTLPERRAELYDVWLRGLIRSRLYKGFGEDEKKQLPTQQIIISFLAFHTHQQGQKEDNISVATFSNCIQQFLGCTIDEDSLENLVSDLGNGSGLFKVIDRNTYKFVHQTFQEFFTARWLAKGAAEKTTDIFTYKEQHAQKTLQVLKTYLTDEYWHEVLLLYFGYQALQAPDIGLSHYSALIDYALKLSNKEKQVSAFSMLSQLLLMLQKYPHNFSKFLNTAQKVQNQLVSLIEDKEQPGDVKSRIFMGELLGLLGDPRLKEEHKWVAIHAGKFWRGAAENDQKASNNENPAGWVHLGPDTNTYDKNNPPIIYKVARWPVTVEEFSAFVKDKAYNQQEFWCKEGWKLCQSENWTGPREQFASQKSNWPVTGVSWFEANAYCRWLSRQHAAKLSGWEYRLPTEAEWERAARGDAKQSNAQRIYAWGDEWQPNRALFNDNSLQQPAAVGLFTLGHTLDTELWDINGNVYEWCLDHNGADKEYGIMPYTSAQAANPLNQIGNGRVIRGGGWNYESRSLRVSDRYWDWPWGRIFYVGFRLFLSPVQ